MQYTVKNLFTYIGGLLSRHPLRESYKDVIVTQIPLLSRLYKDLQAPHGHPNTTWTLEGVNPMSNLLYKFNVVKIVHKGVGIKNAQKFVHVVYECSQSLQSSISPKKSHAAKRMQCFYVIFVIFSIFSMTCFLVEDSDYQVSKNEGGYQGKLSF